MNNMIGRNLKGLFSYGVVWCLFPLVSYAQVDVGFSLPEVALVDVEPSFFEIHLMLDGPTASGGQPRVRDAGRDATKWLNYSCSLKPGATKRSITAHLSSLSKWPSGFKLQLHAQAYTGQGGGDLGIPANKIILSTAPQVLIHQIGGSFTGDGVYNGYNLVYTLILDDIQKVNAATNYQVEVIFTITD